MIEMELLGVRVELPSNTPIVLLRELTGDQRVLPIFIGGPEATAIALALDDVETPRPMTHDLLRNILEDLGVGLVRVEVTELSEGTFYADLVLDGPGGERRISARPSDAVALAVRTDSPIFAAEEVLDEAGKVVDETEDGDEPESAELVEEFKEFIENINPEDFAS